jgi:hypothetical protein
MVPKGIKKIIATVFLAADQTPRYTVTPGGEGWMQYDPLARAMADGLVATSTIPAGSTLQYGNQAVSSFIKIDRTYLKGLILRPLDKWVAQEEVEADYDFDPDAQFDFQLSTDGTKFDSVSTDTLTPGGEVASPWIEMPNTANGFFTVTFKRAAPSAEKVKKMRDAGNFTDASWSRVYFGNYLGLFQWCLEIPSQGKPMLYENLTQMPKPSGFQGNWPETWVPRPWTEGELSEVSQDGMSGQGKTYRFGVIGPAICVTESSFEEDFAYYCAGWYDGHSQPLVAAGSVRAQSWPGAAVFDLVPCYFQEGYLWRYPWEAPSITGVALNNFVWGQAWVPMFLVGVIHGQVNNVANYQYNWEMWVTPASACTPLVESVTVYQYPVLSAGTPLTLTELPMRYEVDGEQRLEESSASRWEIALDNSLALRGFDPEASPSASPSASADGLAYPTALIRPGRVVEIRAGRYYTDGTTDEDPFDSTLPLMGNFTVLGASRDSRRADVQLTDLMGMLHLARWTSGPLCGKGWYAMEFMEFILACAGIGPNQYAIENMGVFLSNGIHAEQEKWLYRDGDTFGSILGHLAKEAQHNGIIWYDGYLDKVKTTCRFCRTMRVTGDWASHMDNGWASSGCLAQDIVRCGATGVDLVIPAGELDVDGSILALPNLAEQRLEAEETVLREGEYANIIRVTGKAMDGRLLEVKLRNDAALSIGAPVGTGYGDYLGREYVHWPIVKTEELPDGCTLADLQERAGLLANELFPWAIQLRGLTMPYTPFLRPGHVIQIVGGQAQDLHEKKFRVTNTRARIGEGKLVLDARELVGRPGQVEASSSPSASPS